MRRLTSWLVPFVLALPASALGQAMQPADLIGTWVRLYDLRGSSDSLKGQLQATYLKVDANGTYAYEWQIKKNDGEWSASGGERPTGSWSLVGDTLELRQGKESDLGSYRVALKDRRLILWDWYMWDANRRDEKCAEAVWERFDSSTALTLPPPPQITIQPADLVGTWAGTFDSKRWGITTDTLVIGADYTLRTDLLGPADDAHERGTWALRPGDVLTGPLGNIDRVTVYLQNGELVRCDDNYPVLKRIAP